MSTFTDFVRQHKMDDSRVRRVYWLFGEEVVFRNLAVDRIKTLFAAEPFNTMTLSLRDTPEAEVWASVNQHPIDSSEKRLLIVQDADRLRNLENLTNWLKDSSITKAGKMTVVFVSNDSEWESEARETVAKSSSAMYVKCALPKDESDRLKRAQEVICSWGNITNTSAGVLALRVNFDMGEARAVMEKVSYFPEAVVGTKTIELLAPRRVEEDIVWSLIALNKRKAADALVETTPDIARVIGALATHTDALARLNNVLSAAKTVKELSQRTAIREQYVRRLYPFAKHYGRKEAVRRTLLLARLDNLVQQGAREGITESLIALW